MSVTTLPKPMAFCLAEEIEYEAVTGHYDQETELWVNDNTLTPSAGLNGAVTSVPAYTVGAPGTGARPQDPDLKFDGWWPVDCSLEGLTPTCTSFDPLQSRKEP
jgi:hypothetical protein